MTSQITTMECYFSESMATIDMRYTSHAQYEMFLLLDGDVTMLINSCKYRITHGALVLLTSKDLHISLNNISTCYKRITIMFDPKGMQMLCSPYTNLFNCFNSSPAKEGNIFYLNEEQIDTFVHYAEIINTYQASIAYGDDLNCLSALISLMIFVNKAYPDKASLKPVPSPPLIRDMVDYIDAHIALPLTVENLCREFSYSESYVSQLFSSHMGIPPKRFILTKKIAYAMELIKANLSMTQVCEKCGFSDYSNFSRTFKQIAGCSPRQWKDLS